MKIDHTEFTYVQYIGSKKIRNKKIVLRTYVQYNDTMITVQSIYYYFSVNIVCRIRTIPYSENIISMLCHEKPISWMQRSNGNAAAADFKTS